MKLTNPTDDELNAAFAEHVAGWQMREVFCGVDGTSTKRLCKPGDIHANYRDEGFTRSMDAVLPHLEKWGTWDLSFNLHKDGYCVSLWQSHPGVGPEYSCPEPPSCEPEHLGHDKSLPRACVIALLRAHGVGVEFTK